jgi:hypothetical protein
MDPIRVRRGTASDWTSANPILKYREVGIESDTGQTKTGDGVTAWSSLSYDAALAGPGTDPGDGLPAWRALAVAPAVSAALIADGAVTTTKIADGAVTAAKQATPAATPRFKSGRYYGPLSARTTSAPGTGVMTAVPFWVHATTTFDRIGCSITTAGAAGTVIRLGIYTDSLGQPSTKVLDAGTVAGDAVASPELTISQSLTAGWYWLAAVSQVGSATLRGVSSTAMLPVGASTVAEACQSVPVVGHTMTGQTGTLPTTFTISASSLSPILVVLRAA